MNLPLLGLALLKSCLLTALTAITKILAIIGEIKRPNFPYLTCNSQAISTKEAYFCQKKRLFVRDALYLVLLWA